MPRAKGGSKTRQRRKKVLKKAKGYVGGRRKLRQSQMISKADEPNLKRLVPYL